MRTSGGEDVKTSRRLGARLRLPVAVRVRVREDDLEIAVAGLIAALCGLAIIGGLGGL